MLSQNQLSRKSELEKKRNLKDDEVQEYFNLLQLQDGEIPNEDQAELEEELPLPMEIDMEGPDVIENLEELEAIEAEVDEYDAQLEGEIPLQPDADNLPQGEIQYRARSELMWSSVPPGLHRLARENIIRNEAGPLPQIVARIQKPVDAFSLFIDDNMFQEISHFTNIFGEKRQEENIRPRNEGYVRTTDVEIAGFIGLLIASGCLHSGS